MSPKKFKELVKQSGGNVNKAFASATKKVILVTIGPEDAALILAHARKNRPLTRTRVNNFVRMQALGKYDTQMSQCILFYDKLGRLVDGQHRLHAQIISGETYTYTCELGATEDHIKILDGVGIRTNSDRFQAFVDDPLISKIVDGKPSRSNSMDALSNAIYNSLVGEKKPTLEESIRIIKYYKEEFLYLIDTIGSNRLLKRTSFMMAALLAYRWAKKHDDLDALKKCIEQMRDGKKLDGVPLVMRNYLEKLSLRTSKGKNVLNDSQWIIFVKCMRGFQAFLTDEPISVLQNNRASLRSKHLREWFLETDIEKHAKKLRLTPTRDFVPKVKKTSVETEVECDE